MSIKDTVIEQIKIATAADSSMSIVYQFCQSSWPDVNNLSTDVRFYLHSRDHKTCCDEFTVNDRRMVIPPSLRPKSLDTLHATHQDIIKLRAQAYETIW